MKKIILVAGCTAVGVGIPFLSEAQNSGLASGIGGLQTVLDQLYANMWPLSGQLIGVGEVLAGLAALGYIGVRVGKHIAAGEGVNVFPLLRPFVIGILILLYPDFIAGVNAVLSPTVSGTAAMVSNANGAIATLLQQKEAALQNTVSGQLFSGADGSGNETLWELYAGAVSSDPVTMISSAFSFQLGKAYFNLKNTIKVWMAEILQVVYEAAALCINAIRTFNMIVLAILGPLVLGLSVFDVFKDTLSAWLARYVHVYLWLPVANIFGAIIATIQTQMIQLDIQQIQSNGSTYFSPTDIAYLIFLIIGIIGYLKVPTITGYIVQAAGSNAIGGKVTEVIKSTVQKAKRAGAAMAGM